MTDCAAVPADGFSHGFVTLLSVALLVGLDPMTERAERRKWGSRPGEAVGEKLERTPIEQR